MRIRTAPVRLPPPSQTSYQPTLTRSLRFCVIDRWNLASPGFQGVYLSGPRPAATAATTITSPFSPRNFTSTPTAKQPVAMSSKLIPSNPADVMVIRNVTPNIVTFSVPFARFGQIKVGGRGTVVKLTSGNLAVFSPVAMTDAVKEKVAEMGGNVAYIVALDYEHHIFISEWAKEYPGAKLIGPEGLPEKRAGQDDPKIGKEEFAVVFTPSNKAQLKIGEEFDADFDYEYVDGHANREIVFVYKPEKVLIEADLLFNLPAREQYSRVPAAEQPADGIANKLFNCFQNPGEGGNNKWMKRFNWHLASKNKASYSQSVKNIDQWEFTKIIPCHGDVIEENAHETFKHVFEWHLKA